jgi:hypothetical protein
MSDMDHVIREALAQGWQHDRTTRGHHQFYSPNGRDIITHSGTPSDHRAFNNFLARMKRAGYMVDSKRIKYGAAKKEILAYLHRHEGQEVTKDDLKAYLRSVLPGISEVTILKNLRVVETTEGVTNTPIGMIYRKIVFTATPVTEKAPEAKPIATPTISRDTDEQELDEALEALAKIERIIRRHKEIARYLARIAKEIEP